MNTSKFFVTAIIILLGSISGIAQVSTDSINSLKQQKQSLELSSKINTHKMQLAKLENTLNKKTSEMESTSAEAQKAANENADLAAKLSNEPQDKQLARKAEKAGDYAKKCAKRARIATDDLDNLKKDIELLKKKIADEETELAVNPVIVPTQQ